jgi:sortase A
MKKIKKGSVLIIIGSLLIISALAWTGFNYLQSYKAGKASQDAVVELKDTIEENSSDYSYIANPNIQMPIATANGHDYIGILKIDSLNLELPIMSEFSYDNLSISPCRYTGSVYNSNLVIAGHNYQSHFANLRKINIGDSVVFTDIDSNVFTYTVEDLEIMPPTDVDKMVNGDWDLTLFTCTIGAKTRLAVRCTLS